MSRRVRLLVSGRVQGVGYRASAQQQALSLGLVGWVRNKADGGVEILAEGPSMSISAFIDWCGRGPRWASVDRVQVLDETPAENLSGFFVKRDD